MVYFIYSDKYYLDWPGHIFPGTKFRLLYEKLLVEKIITPANLLEPVPVREEEVRLVHTVAYLARLRELTREPMRGLIEFEVPVSERVIEAFYYGTGGTILAARTALEKKTATMNLSGGFHHAFSTSGEGFCLINDLAVAIRVMQKEGLVRRAVVIDCDLHQGNGTAHIFQNNPDVFTFSIHQENNYPVKQKSSLDIGLDDFTSDAEYLSFLKKHIPKIIKSHRPGLILYQAGVDPYERDQLGNLKLTKDGLRERDEFIMRLARQSNIPIVVTLGGGYPPTVEEIVELHAQTASVLAAIYRGG